MDGGARIKQPIACSDVERREFERLVRVGFRGSDEGLPGRIRAAQRLGFFYASDGRLTAIAGLKTPADRYRDVVFEKAAATAGSADYDLELGWVFVDPEHRRSRIATRLCARLLAGVPASSVFAMTRTTNHPMIRLLRGLGFAPAGKPYQRRDEELTLFLRPRAASSPRSASLELKP